MYKLLNAGFSRLKKDKVLWSMVIINLGLACFFTLNSSGPIDINFKQNLIMIGIFLAIFVSLFVGREYSDGVIRNKIIVGHSRTNIYLSNLVISLVGTLLIELSYILVVAIIGIPLLGKITLPLSTFAVIMLDILMIIAAYTAIFNFVSLIFSNITMSLVINIILVLAMFITDIALAPTANASEFRINSIMNEQGEIQQIKIPNQNYPGETKKRICQTICYIIPIGQVSEISSFVSNITIFGKADENIDILPLYSLGLVVVVSGIGMYLFNRKELK